MDRLGIKIALDAVRDEAFEDLKMGKDSELVVLQVILDTTKTCLAACGVGELPNPTKKGGE